MANAGQRTGHGPVILDLDIASVPKLFGLSIALTNRQTRRGFGGVWGLTSGVLMETVLSSLFAHVMMIVQSAAIFDIIRGRDSGWIPKGGMTARYRWDGCCDIISCT